MKAKICYEPKNYTNISTPIPVKSDDRVINTLLMLYGRESYIHRVYYEIGKEHETLIFTFGFDYMDSQKDPSLLKNEFYWSFSLVKFLNQSYYDIRAVKTFFEDLDEWSEGGYNYPFERFDLAIISSLRLIRKVHVESV